MPRFGDTPAVWQMRAGRRWWASAAVDTIGEVAL